MDENKDLPQESGENNKPKKKLRAKDWIAFICTGLAVACVIVLAVLVAIY